MVAFTWQNDENRGSLDNDDRPQKELPISCDHHTTGKTHMHRTCEVLNMPEIRKCTHAENL